MFGQHFDSQNGVEMHLNPIWGFQFVWTILQAVFWKTGEDAEWGCLRLSPSVLPPNDAEKESQLGLVALSYSKIAIGFVIVFGLFPHLIGMFS